MPEIPDRNDWYFEECPSEEVDYCWTYEYARESTRLKELIAKWREGSKGNKIGDYIALADEIYAEPLSLAVYPFFPCWPSKPYLSIESKIRKEWLKQITVLWTLDEDELYQINARYHGRQSLRRMLERFERTGSMSFRNGSRQFVVFVLDWDLHDKGLETLFHRWLKNNRPKDAKPSEMRGRGNPTRKGMTILRYLSAYRLRKSMSIADAMAFLQDEGGKLKLYEHYQDWDLAVEKAKCIIRNLENGSFIVPPERDGFQGGTIGARYRKLAAYD
jgi:hypothetical protein